MRVAVTGGTGFVGSHAVAAILARGHDVRLLVRTPAAVAPAMTLQGIDPSDVEVATADLGDHAALHRGLDGCDAVVHAASVFSFDPARAAEMATVNVAGMRAVIDGAVAAGLDPIVHVSSQLALLRTDALHHPVGPDAPPGDSPYPYSGSKADQERVARTYQEDGHPVVIVHPSGVWGPRDPYLGETQQLAQAAKHGLLAVVPPGGASISDARDVAEVLAATLEPGRGPRRYSAAGHYQSFADTVRALLAATGVRRPLATIPDGAARVLERSLAPLNRRGRGTGLPVTAEKIWIARHVPVPDNSRTQAELDVSFRPIDETLGDHVAWMQAVGNL